MMCYIDTKLILKFMKERESFSITWNRIEKKDRELEKCLE